MCFRFTCIERPPYSPRLPLPLSPPTRPPLPPPPPRHPLPPRHPPPPTPPPLPGPRPPPPHPAPPSPPTASDTFFPAGTCPLNPAALYAAASSTVILCCRCANVPATRGLRSGASAPSCRLSTL